MPENPDWERHWNTICLGIVTVATAAIGGAFFAADFTTGSVSLPEYVLTIIAIMTYLIVLIRGGDTIFSSDTDLQKIGTSKRHRARSLYGWFFLELFALAGLLILNAYSSFLQSLQPALPMQ